MYQTIGEKIEVATVYAPAHPKLPTKLKPIKFKWQGRVYPIDQITLVVDAKDGGIRQRLYSVVVKGNVYRLQFNRENELWTLEEIWLDG